jgi:low temperature requirement protein LtrA
MLASRAMEAESAHQRLTAVMREGERVMPLELFFDLVFVLALTQCTALMVANPSWAGLAQGVLVLALLWWAWTGYAWLTSVVDPEEGAVRLALVVAMAALLIAALTVPDAFGGLALEFTLAYAVVRAAHVALFLLASGDDPMLRHSVTGLGASTAAGVVLLILGALLGGTWQAILWTLALLPDLGFPYFFSADGWRLVPAHFAERHGLVVIVALGESIVALGVGSEVGLSPTVATTAVLGVVFVFALWWLYFDVVAIANVLRLVRAPPGREQNELARDVYSYLHLPLVAGIVLAALGLHDTLAHAKDPLKTVPAFALLGGVAIYLLGHVAVRKRGVHTLNRQRLGLALLLLALVPVAAELDALVTLAAVTALLAALIAYETRLYGEGRGRVRHDFAVEGAAMGFSPPEWSASGDRGERDG